MVDVPFIHSASETLGVVISRRRSIKTSCIIRLKMRSVERETTIASHTLLKRIKFPICWPKQQEKRSAANKTINIVVDSFNEPEHVRESIL
jgi:hypothetical protein